MSDPQLAELSKEDQLLTLMLRAAMELHATEPQRGHLHETLRDWARRLYGEQFSKRSLDRLERLVREQPLPAEVLSPLDVSEMILVGLVLVWFALADTDVSYAEQQFLKRLLTPLAEQSGLSVGDLQDWLAGSWPEERFEGFDAVVNTWCEHPDDALARIASRVKAYSEQHRTLSTNRQDFHALRENVRERLEELTTLAKELGSAYDRRVSDAITNLEQLRRLRIAVLGEFKRGKSTLINALLQRPDFMPTDMLPSTSAIIEIYPGSPDRYEQLVDLETNRYQEYSKAQFHANAGDADARSRKAARGERDEQLGLPRWRVRTSSDFLDGAEKITLVDSPGLNEDPIRDRLSREEARRAHAAILVLSASQLLSSYEREIAELLANKVRGLIVVINRIDEVGEGEFDRLRARVMDHLGPLGLQENQVIPLNAKGVEQQIRAKVLPAQIEGLQLLHGRVTDVALRNIMPLRMTSLKDGIERLVNDCHILLDTQERELEKEFSQLQSQSEARRKQREEVEEEIARFYSDMKWRGRDTALEMREAFDEDWGRILKATKKKRGSWTTSKNPLFSPQEATKEIAQKAEHDLIENIEGWAKVKFEEKVQPDLHEAIDNNKPRIDAVAEYLNELTGMDKDEVRERLLKETVKTLVGEDVEVDSVGGVWASVLAAVVSLLVGYIVADIILYYILSVIAGFFNPILLAAAVLAGLIIYLLGGREAVLATLQKRIAKKIIGELQKEKNRNKIGKGVANKIEDIFVDFGNTFKELSESYLDEADYHVHETIYLLNSSDEKRAAFHSNAARFRQELENLEVAVAQATS